MLKLKKKEVLRVCGVKKGFKIFLGTISVLFGIAFFVFLILYQYFKDTWYADSIAVSVYLPLFISCLVVAIITIIYIVIINETRLLVTNNSVIKRSIFNYEEVISIDEITSLCAGGLFSKIIIGTSSHKIRFFFIDCCENLKELLYSLQKGKISPSQQNSPEDSSPTPNDNAKKEASSSKINADEIPEL
jgi:hypothetical protein